MAGNSFSIKTNLPAWQTAMARLAGKDMPAIVAESINKVAEKAHLSSLMNQKHSFVKLNKYSTNSMRFYKANPKANISKINAVTGSVSPYLVKQDMGGTTTPKSGTAVAVPTLAARGGSKRNVILPRFRIGSKKSKFFVLRFKSGHKGLWYRRDEWVRGSANRIQGLVQLRDLSKSAVKIRAMGWHRNAVRKFGTQSAMNQAFAREMRQHGH